MHQRRLEELCLSFVNALLQFGTTILPNVNQLLSHISRLMLDDTCSTFGRVLPNSRNSLTKPSSNCTRSRQCIIQVKHFCLSLAVNYATTIRDCCCTIFRVWLSKSQTNVKQKSKAQGKLPLDSHATKLSNESR